MFWRHSKTQQGSIAFDKNQSLPLSLTWWGYPVALGLLCLSNLVLPITFPLPIEVGGGAAHCPARYKCWRHPSAVLRGRNPWSERWGDSVDSPSAQQMLALCSGMSCCYLWGSWCILCRGDAAVNHVHTTRGEGLLSSVTSVHLTRTAGEPLRCSTVQFTTMKAVQGISSDTHVKSLEPSKTCLWAALLCNMTLQCWWLLCSCFLKRSSHI